MEYEKFDLKRALAGEAVQLRGGLKAFVRYHEAEFEMDYPLMGVTIRSPSNTQADEWTIGGNFTAIGLQSIFDIIGMWPKEALTMPDSFWDMLTPEVVAIAKDGDGEWYSYTSQLVYCADNLTFYSPSGGEHFELSTFNPSIFPECEPKDSLILRPNK